MQPATAAIRNIESAAQEIPDARAYAQRVGMPINGKLDLAKAMKERAAEIQSHFSDRLLKPHVADVNAVPEEYKGERTGGKHSQATLGAINDRVNTINQKLKPNYRVPLAMKTAEMNAIDEALIAEKEKLTDILHGRLGDLHGLAPEDIASVRQRAGKLRSMAQEMKISGTNDTLAAGRQTAGGGITGIGHAGIADRAVGLAGRAAKGGPGGAAAGVIDALSGPEVTGNRMIKGVLDDPAFAPKEAPLPEPRTPDPAMEATTPEAAQQEFLRQHTLQQQARDAAIARNSEAERLRAGNVGIQKEAAQQEVIRQVQGQQTAQDLAAARNKFANSHRAANVSSAQDATDMQATANREAAQQEVAKAVELQNAAQDAAEQRSAVATAARKAAAPAPEPAPIAPERAVPASVAPMGDAEIAPAAEPTAGADTHIEDKVVTQADEGRGVQEVKMPVIAPDSPAPSHPLGEVTGIDHDSGQRLTRDIGS